MKRIGSIVFLLAWPFLLNADSSAHLMLRALVQPSINTNISRTDLSSTSSLWILSSQVNSRYMRESQKFEVEGLDQDGVESHVKKVTASDRTVQYELLVKRLKTTIVTERPIFLKISAN